MEPQHHEPWDTMHEAAHAYAVERLNEEIEKHREAAGWIRILPETTEHVVAMMDAIGNQLKSILNQVDRPTGLADFDNDIDAEANQLAAERDDLPVVGPAPKAPVVYRINELGDIDTDDPDVRK